MSRRRTAMTLAAVSVVSVGVAAGAAWLQLRGAASMGTALSAVAIVAAAAASWLSLRRRWLRIVAAGLAVLLLLGVAAVAWWGPLLDREVLRVVSRTPAPDGTTALVVRLGYRFPQIDPSYDVVLQRDRGPLSQKALVWEGVEEGEPPRIARFVGPHEIEIVAGGCAHRTSFHPTTLRPERVSRQPALDRCG